MTPEDLYRSWRRTALRRQFWQVLLELPLLRMLATRWEQRRAAISQREDAEYMERIAACESDQETGPQMWQRMRDSPAIPPALIEARRVAGLDGEAYLRWQAEKAFTKAMQEAGRCH